MAYRIYLTDDDRFLVDLYALKFKSTGHDVTSFGGGEELIAALRKGGERPDAILLDIIMPGLDGFDTLDAIRKEGFAKDVPIIMLTNQGNESDVEKARARNVAGYIIKASAIPSEVVSETEHIIENFSKRQS